MTKREVEMEELWSLRTSELTEKCSEQVLLAWNEQPQGARRFKLALFRAMKGDIMRVMVLQLLWMLFAILSPSFFVTRILHVIQEQGELKEGLLYAVGFSLCEVGRAISVSQWWMHASILGLKLRSATSTVVFNKVTKLLPGTFASGDVVNMVSSDGERFYGVGRYGIFLIATPVTLSVVFIVLTFMLGRSAILGFVLLVLFVPLQGRIGKKAGALRKKVASFSDERVHLMEEILKAVKLIKFYAWENRFASKVSDVRATELGFIKAMANLIAWNAAISFSGPVVVSAVTFICYYYIEGKNLAIAPAFAALALFQVARFPLVVFPYAMKLFAEAKVGCMRMEKFLNLPEVTEENRPIHEPLTEKDEPVVDLQNCTFSWYEPAVPKETGDVNEAPDVVVPIDGSSVKEKQFHLSKLSCRIYPGELCAVIGKVGAGKSSFINALLGCMQKEEGHAVLRHNNGIGLVEQQPWTFNATMKENILFGKPYDETKFNAAIEAAALLPDIKILPAGIMTEIGERGINLSGGQKARISLARALYAEADLYLFDDPLSAVDAHVGNHIFQKAIRESEATILLVTHQMQYLEHVDKIILLNDGEIQFMGTYAELAANPALYEQIGLVVDEVDKEEIAEISASDAVIEAAAIVAGVEDESEEESKEIDSDAVKAGKTLLRKEDRAKGAVSGQALRRWIGAMGGKCAFFFIFFAFLSAQLSKIGSDWWITVWLGDEKVPFYSFDDSETSQIIKMCVYGGFVLLVIITNVIAGVGYAAFSLKASRQLHDSVFATLLRATPSFFDSTPIGLLLNRFSSDIDLVDTVLLNTTETCFSLIIQSVLSIITITIIFPIFWVVLIPVIILYVRLALRFRRSIRQVKRMDSISKSPLIGHLQGTLEGLISMHAYAKEQIFRSKNMAQVDYCARAKFAYFMLNRWVGIRIDMLTTLLGVTVGILSILSRDFISPSLAGLALVYGLSIGGILQYGTRLMTETEAIFTSVERLTYFETSTPLEISSSVDSPRTTPADWPQHGEIVFQNLSVRYKKDLPCVLRDVSCTIPSRQRIAIVGRTGSGKSTMAFALWRMLEAVEGSISIDGVDISKIELSHLRTKLSIIPQTPTLFIGTIRSNLDPFNLCPSDELLWQALEQVQMKEFIAGLPEGLNAPVKGGGENLSVGQRQLLCFSRALLRGSQIILMDEATASVDQKTDEMIQAAMEKAFSDHTVIVIAHRLNTIMSSDKILVLDDGEVAEFGKPSELVKVAGGHFASLVNETGIENAKRLKALIRS